MSKQEEIDALNETIKILERKRWAEMRLVDANKLLRPGYTDFFDEPITFDMVSKEAIDRAPTVAAIPVEWIEEWQNKHEWEYETFFRMKEGVPKYAVECMIEDWREENATV